MGLMMMLVSPSSGCQALCTNSSTFKKLKILFQKQWSHPQNDMWILVVPAIAVVFERELERSSIGGDLVPEEFLGQFPVESLSVGLVERAEIDRLARDVGG